MLFIIAMQGDRRPQPDMDKDADRQQKPNQNDKQNYIKSGNPVTKKDIEDIYSDIREKIGVIEYHNKELNAARLSACSNVTNEIKSILGKYYVTDKEILNTARLYLFGINSHDQYLNKSIDFRFEKQEDDNIFNKLAKLHKECEKSLTQYDHTQDTHAYMIMFIKAEIIRAMDNGLATYYKYKAKYSIKSIYPILQSKLLDVNSTNDFTILKSVGSYKENLEISKAMGSVMMSVLLNVRVKTIENNIYGTDYESKILKGQFKDPGDYLKSLAGDVYIILRDELNISNTTNVGYKQWILNILERANSYNNKAAFLMDIIDTIKIVVVFIILLLEYVLGGSNTSDSEITIALGMIIDFEQLNTQAKKSSFFEYIKKNSIRDISYTDIINEGLSSFLNNTVFACKSIEEQDWNILWNCYKNKDNRGFQDQIIQIMEKMLTVFKSPWIQEYLSKMMGGISKILTNGINWNMDVHDGKGLLYNLIKEKLMKLSNHVHIKGDRDSDRISKIVEDMLYFIANNIMGRTSLKTYIYAQYCKQFYFDQQLNKEVDDSQLDKLSAWLRYLDLDAIYYAEPNIPISIKPMPNLPSNTKITNEINNLLQEYNTKYHDLYTRKISYCIQSRLDDQYGINNIIALNILNDNRLCIDLLSRVISGHPNYRDETWNNLINIFNEKDESADDDKNNLERYIDFIHMICSNADAIPKKDLLDDLEHADATINSPLDIRRVVATIIYDVEGISNSNPCRAQVKRLFEGKYINILKECVRKALQVGKKNAKWKYRSYSISPTSSEGILTSMFELVPKCYNKFKSSVEHQVDKKEDKSMNNMKISSGKVPVAVIGGGIGLVIISGYTLYNIKWKSIDEEIQDQQYSEEDNIRYVPLKDEQNIRPVEAE